MNTRNRKKSLPTTLKDRLAAFPQDSGNHLDELLAKNPDNPFVKMVRWFFLYPDAAPVSGRVRHVPSGASHHRKSLAH